MLEIFFIIKTTETIVMLKAPLRCGLPREIRVASSSLSTINLKHTFVYECGVIVAFGSSLLSGTGGSVNSEQQQSEFQIQLYHTTHEHDCQVMCAPSSKNVQTSSLETNCKLKTHNFSDKLQQIYSLGTFNRKFSQCKLNILRGTTFSQ